MSKGRLCREGLEDSRLVRSCRSGDEEAFAALVRKYQDPLYNTAVRMVGDREEARDLAQEAFVRAFEGIEGFDTAMPFRAWLFRIGVNAAIDHLRSSRRTDVTMTDAFSLTFFHDREPGAPPEPPGPESDIPENVMVSNEVSRAVHAALAGLPEKFRVVAILHHMEGFSYTEVARVLGVPRNTAKTWARRARGMLCEALEGVV